MNVDFRLVFAERYLWHRENQFHKFSFISLAMGLDHDIRLTQPIFDALSRK
jgi:hypothetical protein